MNLDSIKNIYIIGIEGAGTSALALLLQAQGKNVVGSDEGDHFYYDVLKKAGIKVWHKFDEDNLKKVVKTFGAEASKAGLIKASEAGLIKRSDSEALSPASSERTKLIKSPAFSERIELKKIDLIIYSTAVQPETNPELKYAMEVSEAGLIKRSDSEALSPASGERTKLIKILSYPQALAMVFNNSEFGIAVCGTHGKTTTTAMLATAMEKAGAKVSALVGSKVLEWGSGVLVSGDDYFIIEADEYQNKLQHYNPRGVILTSADYDHPDFFKTEEDYLQAFKDFVARIPEDGFLVAYAGDKNVLEISRSAKCEVIFYDNLAAKEILLSNDFCSLKNKVCRGKTFGCCPAARVTEEKKDDGENKNDGKNKGDEISDSSERGEVRLFGEHNLLNAMATFRVCQKLELDLEKVKEALRNFQGTARRFEKKGKYNGAIIIDDYAHHPVEVRATLQSARERYPNKTLKVIFHPHTFTRTQALLDEFASSFTNADEVYLLDIFGSAREKRGGVSSDDLVEKIKAEASKVFEAVPLPEQREGEVRLLKTLRIDKKASEAGLIKRSDSEALSPASSERTKLIKSPASGEKIAKTKNLHTIPEAIKYFQKNLTKDDLLITMGAGDVYLVGEELIN